MSDEVHVRCVSWCNGHHRSVCPTHRPGAPEAYWAVSTRIAVSATHTHTHKLTHARFLWYFARNEDARQLGPRSVVILTNTRNNDRVRPGMGECVRVRVSSVTSAANIRNRVSAVHIMRHQRWLSSSAGGCHLHIAQQQREFRQALRRPHPPSPPPQDDEPHHVRARMHIILL